MDQLLTACFFRRVICMIQSVFQLLPSSVETARSQCDIREGDPRNSFLFLFVRALSEEFAASIAKGSLKLTKAKMEGIHPGDRPLIRLSVERADAETFQGLRLLHPFPKEEHIAVPFFHYSAATEDGGNVRAGVCFKPGTAGLQNLLFYIPLANPEIELVIVWARTFR
jgi:hypothetical protein